jgi:Family of unknown function (DUF6934)
MSYQTCICLQAQADFSAFWFTLGVRGALLMEMRFTGQQQNVFDLTLEKRYLFEDPLPAFFNENDVDTLLYAVVQAIELYTGKYPERSVRCKAGEQIQTLIFKMILRTNQEVLAGMFSINEEGKERFRPFSRRPDDPSFLLKRKPDPQRGPHPIQLTLNTYSQLFGKPVFVRLCDHRSYAADNPNYSSNACQARKN